MKLSLYMGKYYCIGFYHPATFKFFYIYLWFLFHRYLPDSRGVLLDIIVANLEDGYPQVSGPTQNRLRELTKIMDNVGEKLRERIYLQASKLPRILHKNGNPSYVQ